MVEQGFLDINVYSIKIYRNKKPAKQFTKYIGLYIYVKYEPACIWHHNLFWPVNCKTPLIWFGFPSDRMFCCLGDPVPPAN